MLVDGVRVHSPKVLFGIGVILVLAWWVLTSGQVKFSEAKEERYSSKRQQQEQTRLVKISRFPLMTDFDVLDIGWLTSNDVVVFGTVRGVPHLLVLPGKREVRLQFDASSRKFTERPNWIIHPHLVVADNGIFLNWKDAVFFSKDLSRATTDLKMDPVLIFDLSGSPLDQIEDRIISIRWAPLEKESVWSACCDNGDGEILHLTHGLQLEEPYFASAISRDGKAILKRRKERKEVTVAEEMRISRINPRNGQTIWNSIPRLSAYELFTVDFIDWSDRMGAAVISYAPDTAGALSYMAIVRQEKAKIVFKGGTGTTTPQGGTVEDSPRWLRDHIIFCTKYDQEKRRALLIYHPNKDIVERPSWGEGGELPTPNTDGSKIAFLRRGSNGKGGQIVIGTISAPTGGKRK